jgi:hypothetical protein
MREFIFALCKVSYFSVVRHDITAQFPFDLEFRSYMTAVRLSEVRRLFNQINSHFILSHP